MKPFGVDAGDVAGAQPAVVELVGAGRVVVVVGGDPGAAHLDLAGRLAVPGDLGAVVVDQPHLDQRHDPPGRGPVVPTRASLPTSSSGGFATEPTGLISVMPQAWIMRAPWRCSKSRASDSGIGAPPQMITRRLEKSAPFSSAWRSMSSQIVGTPAATVTFSLSISFASGSPWRKRDGITMSAPTRAAGVGQAPGVGVEHRHHRQHAIGPGDAERVAHADGHAVQHVRAVRVERALGVAGRAARVAEAGGGALVELGVVEARLVVGEQVLVADHVRQRARVAVADDDVVLDRLEARRDLLEHRHQRVVDEDDLVLGVVDDVAELLLEQADVERVQHRARAGHAHVDLEVLLRVPHEGRDPIAVLDAQLLQRLAEPVDAVADRGVRQPRRATVGQRHDLACRRSCRACAAARA